MIQAYRKCASEAAGYVNHLTSERPWNAAAPSLRVKRASAESRDTFCAGMRDRQALSPAGWAYRYEEPTGFSGGEMFTRRCRDDQGARSDCCDSWSGTPTTKEEGSETETEETRRRLFRLSERACYSRGV